MRNRLRIFFAVFFCFVIYLNLSAQSEIVAEFPIKIERNKTMIPVTIGNTGPLKLILDSGMASDGILLFDIEKVETSAFDRLTEYDIQGAGGGSGSKTLVADSASFYINKTKFEDQQVIILTSNTFKGFPTDGVIGYSILGHYTVKIDYDTEIMTLYKPGMYPPDNSWEELPIYFKDNMIPWTDAQVVIKNEEPITLSMYIDYASGEAIELLVRDNNKFTMPDETEDVFLGRGLSGDVHGKRGFISKIILGKYELQNVKASFAPAEIRSKQKNADGVLGNNTFRRFNVVFDYADKKMFIKPNKYFELPF